jgi:hypothetical protein
LRYGKNINYETVKHLYDAESPDTAAPLHFRVVGGGEPSTVTIPASVVHRLFRLGQAFNLHFMRYLEPDAKYMVGSTELSRFVKDLHRLKKVVNDEVTHQHVDALLRAINEPPGAEGKHIAVSVGEFYTRGA